MAPSQELPALSTVWIPGSSIGLNENVTPAGQTGGLMGRQWDPDHFIGDPSQIPTIDSINSNSAASPLCGCSNGCRYSNKSNNTLAKSLTVITRSQLSSSTNTSNRPIVNFLPAAKARDAFAIDKEPESSPPLATVTTAGDSACCSPVATRSRPECASYTCNGPANLATMPSTIPLWDTHAQNADRLEDVLCPQFDVGFSALIEDLDQRGLLDETLVVAVGEFGRTPKINSKGGRDHWGACL